MRFTGKLPQWRTPAPQRGLLAIRKQEKQNPKRGRFICNLLELFYPRALISLDWPVMDVPCSEDDSDDGLNILVLTGFNLTSPLQLLE